MHNSTKYLIGFDLQRLQLGILVVSLEDHSHVAALLGYTGPDQPHCSPVLQSDTQHTDQPISQQPPTTLPKDLMHTLLANLTFHTVSQISYG